MTDHQESLLMMTREDASLRVQELINNQREKQEGANKEITLGSLSVEDQSRWVTHMINQIAANKILGTPNTPKQNEFEEHMNRIIREKKGEENSNHGLLLVDYCIVDC
jgi:hypothetical protein